MGGTGASQVVASQGFSRAAAAAVAPLIELLSERLAGTAGLTGIEREVVLGSARQSLVASAQLKLNRVFLLEMHAASLAGELPGTDPHERWAAFVDIAATASFRERLDRRYPTLRARLEAAGRHFVTAISTLAQRLVHDRDSLAQLLDPCGAPGTLRALRLDVGDPHRGGQTVARLDFDAGSVMYKPRPVEAEVALDAVLAALLPEAERIATPKTLAMAGYGWSRFIRHRYCADDAQTRLFYRNLGRWLAIMRLIGGIDLHAENIVADGPVPVVVDAETLFAACPPAASSGLGAATDAATGFLRRAVLRTGILPMRAGIWDGVDLSALGNLPGEQPEVSAPVIVDAGTDGAHVARKPGTIIATRNHPSPLPEPERFWEEILAGFHDLSERLCRLDDEGSITCLLRPFLGCEVRQVLRSTRVYGDLRRMLWHPAALHDEPAAVERAREVLRHHAAAATSGAPSDQAGMDAEIAGLLVGDTPVFTRRVDQSVLDEAIAGWRSADLAAEARVIRYAVTGAFHSSLPAVVAGRFADPGRPLDLVRRDLAAAGVRELRDSAIRGPDGTATWVGPVRGPTGWLVRPLPADAYCGQAGVVVCLAGYLQEARAERADPVEGLTTLVNDALVTLRATGDAAPAAGTCGLAGLGGQVWAWCALSRLLGEPGLVDRAERCASLLSPRVEDRGPLDVLTGIAGAIVPVLDLATATGRDRWLAEAAALGHGLAGTAIVGDDGARWPAAGSEDVGGFAQGSAGIGWALARLADSQAGRAADRDRWRALAQAAFRHSQAYADARPEAWASRPDLRVSWCLGGAGTGLAAADLYARTGDDGYLRRARQAADAASRDGLRWGRTLCHGDPGVWELLAAMRRTSPQPPVPAADQDLDARLLRRLRAPARPGLESAEAASPGLFTGLAGVVLTLLRMHPEHRLCSPLLLDWARG